jgi:hypothetical protein
VNQTVLIVVIVVAVVLVGFRIYRLTGERRWSVSRMWIAPAILLILAAVVAAIDVRATPFVIVGAVVGLAAGVAIGLYQGTHTTVRVDKAIRSLYVKVSPIGMLIFVGVLALRLGLRYITGSFAPAATATHSPALPTLTPLAAIAGSALLALAVGMVLGLRVYMQRRYNAAPAS